MLIPIDEINDMMDSDPKMLLVDVRSQDEFDAAHIPGAGWMPVEVICDMLYDEAVSEAGLDAIAHMRGMEMADDASIIVFCSGNAERAQQAVTHMEALGYVNVYALEGITDYDYDFVSTEEERSQMAADAALAEELLAEAAALKDAQDTQK